MGAALYELRQVSLFVQHREVTFSETLGCLAGVTCVLVDPRTVRSETTKEQEISAGES